MTWLTILRLLLSVADKIADIVRASQLMTAGEAKEVAKQLTGIAERLRITDEIRANVAALTDDELDKELAGTDPL